MNLSTPAAAMAQLLPSSDTRASEPQLASPSADAIEQVHRAFDAAADAVYRFFAIRTGDRHLADDLMQQLWLQARTAATAVPPASLEAWLRTVARNLLRTHWRVKARRPAHVPIPDADLAARLADRLVSADLPAEQLQQREVRDQLLLAMTALPADDQALMIGCYFQNESHQALATRWGVSERAIEGRLYRARQALRQHLASLDDV